MGALLLCFFFSTIVGGAGEDCGYHGLIPSGWLMPALPAAPHQLYCTHLYHYGKRGVHWLDGGGLERGIILPLVFYCNILMLLLSGFLSGYFPPLLRQTSQHSCCRNIRHSENRWGDFFFSPSCEKYWDCNLRTGNFQLGCGIRGVSVLVPPSQSASSMSLAVGPSSRAVPVKSRDDCRGFVWFNGERLFSTPNRFMAFPTDWYPQSSRQAFNTSHRHKSNWKRSKDWLSVTTDPHTVIEPTPLMNIGWAEGVVVQVWARPRGVVCVCVFVFLWIFHFEDQF